MSEVEKQESQKTVVAFITGLLIGGLLVWALSPAETTTNNKMETESPVVTLEDTQKADSKEQVKSEMKDVPQMNIGDAMISVANQKAQSIVVIDSMKVPTDDGWIVVRDYLDGVPGNVLGAARYSVTEGLMPTEVQLMRNTSANNAYQVVFFNNMGAPEFTLGEDTLIEGVEATFTAN